MSPHDATRPLTGLKGALRYVRAYRDHVFVVKVGGDVVADGHGLDQVAAQIGLLSSIYFLCFAAAQLPLGVALDRFGPRLCMLVSLAVTVLGCIVFALAHSASGLVLGRALLGLGTASFLMAPMALYARWFPPERFSTLAGIQLGVGSLGALFATAPLAHATASFGWRATFLGVGAASIAIGDDAACR